MGARRGSSGTDIALLRPMTRSVISLSVAALLVVGPVASTASRSGVAHAASSRASKRRAKAKRLKQRKKRLAKKNAILQRNSTPTLRARLNVEKRKDATSRGENPFTRPGRVGASNRGAKIESRAKALKEAQGTKADKLAALDALEAELYKDLSYEQKRATIAATVESWIAPSLPKGVEIRAVVEPHQDSHSPRHSIMGRGHWRVRTFRMLPKTANPFRLAYHLVASALDSKSNSSFLVGLSKDGNVPYAVGASQGMTLATRTLRTIRKIIPARELFYNTVTTERGRWALAGIAMSFGTLAMSWFGVEGFSFEKTGSVLAALKTIGTVGVGGAIVNAYQMRNEATRKALKETFAWVKAQNTAETPQFPGFRTVYAQFERKLKKISPSTRPLSRGDFQRIARLEELPSRTKAADASELKASIDDLRTGIETGAADVDRRHKRLQREMELAFGFEGGGFAAASLIEEQLAEHTPDGISVEVVAETNQVSHHPRHAVLGEGLFRVRAKRVSDKNASLFQRGINVIASQLDGRLNAQYLVRVSKGSGLVVGKPRSMTMLARAKRVFGFFVPAREIAHQAMNTDLGKVALGAIVIGTVSAITQFLSGGDLLSMSDDKRIGDLMKWFAAGGIFTTYIQAHFFRAKVRDDAMTKTLDAVRERAKKGRFRGINLVFGELEAATREESPWSVPEDIFALQESLRTAPELPLRPRKYVAPKMAPTMKRMAKIAKSSK